MTRATKVFIVVTLITIWGVAAVTLPAQVALVSLLGLMTLAATFV